MSSVTDAAARRQPYHGGEPNPVQIAIYRSWDGARKMRCMFEMFEFALRQARVGTRSRHPDWDEAQVQARRLVTGTEPAVE
jgi:hypothetical protein